MSTAMLSQPVRIKIMRPIAATVIPISSLTKAMGRGPPAGVGEVAGTFGATHSRGEHQVTEAHGEQRLAKATSWNGRR